jgi:adenylosuccinate synthase
LFDDVGDFIREKGGEYGTVTGRPRRIGWLDLVVVKHSALISGMEQIALTRMDTLAGVKKLKVCVAYELDGKTIDHYPADLTVLEKCKPIYKEFDGWDDDISKVRNYKDLPDAAKKYIETIEEITGAKVSMIGVGPNRDEAILVRNPYEA